MNEELDSQLSAMFDDELAPEECELLARRLSRDEQLKARWGRYAVIGAAIRAERGVRLNARIAGRVRVIMSSEPALGGASEVVRRTAIPHWARPLAGAAVAAGVAAVAILWLRTQETAPLAALTAVRAPLSTAVAAANPSGSPGRSLRAAPRSPDSYTVPAAQHAQEAVVPPTELANYVVAHSMFSQPVARGNLLSSFMTNEAPAVASPAMAAEPPPDPSRDAHSQAQ
ncbi:MAG TPA: sigma-E factor negative regulatory protein [Steroidobacteraceae bacterium]|nr:sigma-E factor negative regulatory protein [Steroidobacteraceae bacterium]